jgi:TGF-beta receptor, other
LEAFRKYRENHIDDVLSEEQLEIEEKESTSPATPTPCPTCKNSVMTMSEDELSELRIEFVKNQILKKLRLTERPPKISAHSVPTPIVDEINTHQAEMEQGEMFKRLDDYYGKTTQKIIFLNRGKVLETEKSRT